MVNGLNLCKALLVILTNQSALHWNHIHTHKQAYIYTLIQTLVENLGLSALSKGTSTFGTGHVEAKTYDP